MSQLSYLRQYNRLNQKDYLVIKVAKMLSLLLLMYLCTVTGIKILPSVPRGTKQLNTYILEKIDPLAILESAMPIIASSTLPKENPKKIYDPILDALKIQLLCVRSPRLMLESQIPFMYFPDSFPQKPWIGEHKQLSLPNPKHASQSNQDDSFPFTKTVNGVEVVFIGKNEYYPVSNGYTGNLAMESIKKYGTLLKKYSSQYDLDPAIPLAIMKIESGGNPNAVSDKGALGIMQITKDTATQWGLSDPLNPGDNIKTAIKILHYYYTIYNGNMALMAAAYNAGIGAVSKYGGVPKYAETQNYVKNFNIWYLYYKKHD